MSVVQLLVFVVIWGLCTGIWAGVCLRRRLPGLSRWLLVLNAIGWALAAFVSLFAAWPIGVLRSVVYGFICGAFQAVWTAAIVWLSARRYQHAPELVATGSLNVDVKF